jgi:hypothetical protein
LVSVANKEHRNYCCALNESSHVVATGRVGFAVASEADKAVLHQAQGYGVLFCNRIVAAAISPVRGNKRQVSVNLQPDRFVIFATG